MYNYVARVESWLEFRQLSSIIICKIKLITELYKSWKQNIKKCLLYCRKYVFTIYVQYISSYTRTYYM